MVNFKNSPLRRLAPIAFLLATLSPTWSQTLTGTHLGTGLAGSDSQSGGVYTVSGGGNDIGSPLDANGNQLEGLRFVGQTLPQDGVFQARVIGMSNTNAKAKAGIEIRQSNDPGAIEAMVGVTPTSGLLWLYKLTTTAASINAYNPAMSAPHWVKIIKDANIVSAYESADGAAWNFINLKPLSFTGATTIGLAVSSHSTVVNCTATFDNVSLLSQPNFGGPAPWTHQDIGDIGLNGAVHFEDPNWTIFGAGSDIWGAADAFHYSYRPLLGDGSIIAYVSGVTNTNPWAKAGVMLRQDPGIGSANLFLALTPGNGVTFQARPVANGATVDVINNPAITGSCWLKLERLGSEFDAYTSSTGAVGSWQFLGTQNIPALSSANAPTIQMGLAETSHTRTALGAAFFSDVQPSSRTLQTSAITDTSIQLIWPSLAPGSAVDHYQVLGSSTAGAGSVTTTSFENVQLTPSTTYAYTVRAFNAAGAVLATSSELHVTTDGPWLPAPWTHADLGATTVGGSTRYDTGTGIYTLAGAGADIGGTADSFQYAWQPFAGDGQIVAHLRTLSAPDPGTKTGIMIREGTGASARYAAITITPDLKIHFEDRVGTTGGFVTATRGTPYRWLKLVRRSDTVTAFTSTNGTTWTILGSDTLPSLASTIDLGLALTGHAGGALASSTMDLVTVSAAATDDGVAPAAPAHLTATAITATSATLTWTPGTDDVAVTGYQILRNDSLIATVSGTTTTYTASGLTSGQSYWFNIAAVDGNGLVSAPASPRLDLTTLPPVALPDPWEYRDIGAVAVAGSATGSISSTGATFTISASGQDIWDGSDSFGYLDQSLSGDGQITAKVNGVPATNAWAKAGVMMRGNSADSDAADSPYAFMLVTPGANGVDYQSRQDVTSQDVPGPQFTDPTIPSAYWVRLVRRGDTYRGYSSPDGQHWTLVAQENLDLEGNDSLMRMGLAVTSHANATLDTVTFTNVTTGISSDPDYDSDGDGIPDQWEIAHGLDPFIPDDAALDSDGDGTSNLDEYLHGTDPAKKDNALVHLSVTVTLQ